MDVSGALDGIQAIYDWITSGIYDFVVEVVSFFIVKWTLFSIELKTLVLQFSWDIARDIISDLKISEQLSSALGVLPPDVRAKMDFFNITSGINLVLNSLITRYVMGFLIK